jgi:hypothetical protein
VLLGHQIELKVPLIAFGGWQSEFFSSAGSIRRQLILPPLLFTGWSIHLGGLES